MINITQTILQILQYVRPNHGYEVIARQADMHTVHYETCNIALVDMSRAKEFQQYKYFISLRAKMVIMHQSIRSKLFCPSEVIMNSYVSPCLLLIKTLVGNRPDTACLAAANSTSDMTTYFRFMIVPSITE